MEFKTLFNLNSNGYIRSVIALLIGILMILWPDSAVNTIILAIGAFLIASGFVTLIIAIRGRGKDVNSSIMYLNSGIGFVFGLLLVLMPGFFVNIIMFLFGAILLLFGISQLASLIRVRKYSALPWIFFIIPTAVTLCGIVVFFNPFKTLTALFVFFGFVLVVYAVSELISTIRIRKVLKNEEMFITDVDYEEVEKDGNHQ